MISEKSIEKTGTTLAHKVVDALEGSEELQQVVMDKISEVLESYFGEEMDDVLEMELSMVALQRISLIVN